MPWRDSHRETFTKQAEARSGADHPSEKAATAMRAKRVESVAEVCIPRLQAPGSLRRAVSHLPVGPGPGDAQWIRGARSAVLTTVGRWAGCGVARRSLLSRAHVS